MSGPIEEAGKLAGSFMDSLKREPLSLALVIMNLSLLLFFYFILATIAVQREREIGLLYADKKSVSELLARCVVPERRSSLSRIESLPLPPLTTKPQPVDDPPKPSGAEDPAKPPRRAGSPQGEPPVK